MADIQDPQKAVENPALLLAKQELEAARKKVSELQVAAQVAPGSEKPKAYQAVDDAKKKADELEARLKALEAQAAPAIQAEHTVASGETLSHLALKYYGKATPPYWQLIYEANKEVIGENPNKVRTGMVLKIPVLPNDFQG